MLRELQALCRSHGLPAGGSNADLAARLAATLPSGRGGAEEKVVVAIAAKGVVGKGCLKRSGGGSSGGRGSGPAKKVTFVLEGEAGAETVTEVRRRSRRLRR